MSIQQTPEPNTIFFSWFNPYSGILLKTQTKTFVIDPVDVKVKSFPVVDAILITHEHYDHLDQPLVTTIQKNTGCAVIADPASAQKLADNLPTDKLITLKQGTQVKIGQVTIKAEKSNHNAKSPNTYIITSEDHVKVYHTSDSLPYPELGVMAQKEQFDVVFCTVGAAPGATSKTGFEIAWLTKPALAVPYHAGSQANMHQFAELIKKELRRTACLIPEQGKIYQVSKRQN
ncbi:MAG TPA: MBL fold metallo-hydrolase [Candidatus Acidoferrales bacterium]|nr:MBL fold metallo-hydrolase [Candidatus Acidoferrales bacterium]